MNPDQDPRQTDNLSPQTQAPQPQTTQPAYEQPAAQPSTLPGAQPFTAAGQPAADAGGENPEKNYLVALLLSYFLGSIGADRFYLGKIGSGVAKLLTFGGLGIWHLIDMLLIAFGKMTAKDDSRPLEGYAKNRSWVKIVAIVLLIMNLITLVAVVILFAVSLSGNHSQTGSRMYDIHDGTPLPASSE